MPSAASSVAAFSKKAAGGVEDACLPKLARFEQAFRGGKARLSPCLFWDDQASSITQTLADPRFRRFGSSLPLQQPIASYKQNILRSWPTKANCRDPCMAWPDSQLLLGAMSFC